MKRWGLVLTLAILSLLAGCNLFGGSVSQNYLLSILWQGEGSGLVTDGDALSCREDCEASFAEGSTVSLSVTPDEGSSFSGFSGACTGLSCQITMNSDQTVTLAFDLIRHQLVVTVNGGGAVESNPAGIDCGNDCEASFLAGTTVALNALLAPDNFFAGWGGDCSGTDTCVLTMDADKTVSASFESAMPQGDLLISEISSSFFSDDSLWFEVYNNAGVAVDLADYQLHSLAELRVSPFSTFGPTTFDIPSLIVPPGGFAVIAGQGTLFRVDGPQLVHVLNTPSTVPRWGENGFVELLKDGQTVDFVRFGNSNQEPQSATAWTGESASALTAGDFSYGHSLVRDDLERDSNSAQDWRPSAFPTAAGPNDIAADASDNDGDGIPDSAEVEGGRYAGLDLFSMGARTNQPDIFVEVDHMEGTREGMLPQPEALQMVVDAFARRGIVIHFDTGAYFSGGFSPAQFNLGNSIHSVPFATGITIPFPGDSLAGRASAFAYKATYMDLNRRNIFHYLLLANSQSPDGSAGSSGLAEFYGNDLIVTIGAWNLDRNTERNTNILINYQAGTILHELGHNLALGHAGPINDPNGNYETNYLSSMNYLYQLRGIGPATGAAAGDRYYLERGLKDIGLCDLVDSPCGDNFVIDYSDGSGQDLDESQLDESKGLGRGDAFVDFDNDGQANIISFDVNNDNRRSVLTDYDDWGNLFYPFYRSWNGNSGIGRPAPWLVPRDILADDVQNWIVEDQPSEAFFRMLDEALD